MQNTALLLIFIFCSFVGISQNGWTKKKNDIYVQLAASTFSSKNYYSLSGDLLNSGATFSSHGILLYGEYGITDRFNVLIDMPVFMVNRFHTTENVYGLGNAKLGLKYRITKKFPFSIQVDFDVPTDDGENISKSLEPNALGQYDFINLPTSDGEFNIWTTLAASQSFASGKAFAGIYASFNYRTQSFSPQFQAGGEVGYLFFNKLYLIGKFKIQERLETGSPVTGSFLYGEGTTFTSYGITSIFKLNDDWNIIAGFSDFGGFITKRRNIYDGPMFFLGAAIDMNLKKSPE